MFNKPAFIYASNPSRESQLVYDVDNTLSYLSESDVSTKKQTRTWFAGPGDDLYEYRESSKDGVLESVNALSHVYALNRQPVASFRQSEVLGATFVEAIQSSESHGGAASRAIDGNTDGIFANGSVTHTTSHYARHWWQGKLDRRTEISSVTLHNRTDCCSDRLKNFTVLISDYDLSGITTLAEAKALSSTSHFHGPALVGNSLKLNFVTGPVKGKYIMVYKEGGNHALSLAEVEVNK